MSKEILRQRTAVIFRDLPFFSNTLYNIPRPLVLRWYERENERQLLNQLTLILEEDDENIIRSHNTN